jgi:hypothetical protein
LDDGTCPKNLELVSLSILAVFLWIQRFDEETIEGDSQNGNTTALKLVPCDPEGKKRTKGLCWFRSDGKVCPFSKQGLEPLAGC